MTRKSTFNRTVFVLLPMFGICLSRPFNIFVIRVFWVATLLFIGFCHYRYCVTHLNSENFFNLIDCLCSFLAHVKVIAKLAAFWLNQKKLDEILELIRDDWSNFANIDSNVRVMAKQAKTSDRFTNAMVFLHTISILAYSFGVFMANIDVTDPSVELLFVNKLEIPFSITTDRTYKIVLISEIVHMIFCNWVSGLWNAILYCLALHAGGQMEILQCWLAQLTTEKIRNEEESFYVTTMNGIILKHQKIIQFSDIIETLFTHIALILFASNTLLICSIGFLIVTSIGTPDAAEQITKCILFYTITNLEAFIFCYAGEYLKNKSKLIGFAAYNCAWYNLKPKDSRTLLFIIIRSQKQLTLTAGKMMDLSLESFASIMNASGSYLSVLLAMQ